MQKKLLIIWMIVIFLFSSQPATNSQKLSDKTTIKIVELITKKEVTTPTLTTKKYRYLIRKSAHFFLYFILGILIYINMKKKSFKIILISIFLSMLYAVSDELHQIFVPGRGAQVKDVLIDTLGSCVGIIFLTIALKIKTTFHCHLNQ